MRYGLFTIVVMVLFLSVVAMSSQAQAQAVYDTISIHDLQFVPNPDSSDQSPFFGDTVVVKGLVMTSPRDLWVGARWSVYIQDPDTPTDPWNGFYIIQHDTFAIQTGFQFVQPGDVAYFTGVVDEFSQLSQVALLTNPPVPVNVVSIGNPMPPPVLLTTQDLATKAAGEQWEAMWVRVEDATIVNNNISGNWASFTDASSSISYLAEYFNWFRDRLNAGTYNWPVPGTNFNVNGFTRDESGSPGQVYNINPRDTLDIEILGDPPPLISDVSRDPGVPHSTDAVTVKATIVDNGSVSQAFVNYSVNWGNFQSVVMTAPIGQDTFSAAIPPQPNGSFVRYLVTAIDNAGGTSKLPPDTSLATGNIFFYDVKDGGLSIMDVQFTHGYALDPSGYAGYDVTLQGVVMTDSTDWLGSFYIEEKDSAWHGIWVRGDQLFNKGDLVEVTGTVAENFNVTRVQSLTNQQLVTAGVGVFNPVVVTTGEVGTGGVNAEAYESIFIRLENLTVSDPFPDDPSNFGEFTVNDNSGDYRVGDNHGTQGRPAFRGNLDSTFGLGDQIAALLGLGYYSFGDYKLLPRDSSDVIGHVPVGVEEIGGPVPATFELAQNYPNPFNPTTDIEYTIAQSGNYTLIVYNVIGQKVRTLVNDYHPIGNYRVRWDGRDNAGIRVGSGIYFYTLQGKNLNLTKKMILLK